LAVEGAGPIDVWHAHDLTGLAAIVPNLPRDARIVYDSHELFLDTGTPLKLPRPARGLLGAYERRLAARAWALVTVNATLEATLCKRLRFTRSAIVHNAPPRWMPPDPAPDLLRDRLGLPPGALIALYHGGLTEDRGLLPLVDALDSPDMSDVHIVFLGSGQLHARLAERARDSRVGGRIHMLDPVPPRELASWVASADVGVMPNQPVNENERSSTPNKLFESMGAGLPVVSSDFPERRRIILGDPDGPLGAVCDPTSPESIASAIRSILDRPAAERAAMRARILKAAHERWNWETEGARLVALYAELATELAN
jgi:glycosyltransferase involved in cell wall biosynthesis